VSRRPIALLLDALLVLVGALLGIATNYATSQTGHLPLAFRLLQRWSLPLVGIALVLLVGGRMWLWWLERPAPIERVWTARRPPYPGLEAFTEQDAGVFFGREAEIRTLVDRFHPTLSDRAHRFVAVIGPSGVGKSSLVHAGLLARLAQRRTRWVVVPSLAPGDQPIYNLARSLTILLPGGSVGTLAERLAGDNGLAVLAGCLQELRNVSGSRSVSILLVIDQAEELLSLTSPQQCDAFLMLLRGALRSDPQTLGCGHPSVRIPHRFLGGRIRRSVSAASHGGCARPHGIGQYH
jgi:AAA ATPase domain